MNDRASSSEPAGNGRQDPIVERLRPDPAQPALRTTTLRGFLGNSELDGRQRIYFTRTLDYYAEFRSEDVVRIAAIAAEESPFPGEAATMVELPPGVTVNYVRARVTPETSPFDLDIRPATLPYDPYTPVFIDTSHSCDIFDTTCTGAGCGYPDQVWTSFECPPSQFPCARR